IWNTTKQPGPNIVGGPFLGGNFWSNPFGTGFSDNCIDTDKDGICAPLEVLKRFMERFRNEESAVFKFQTLNTWKHFFKPFEYSIEEEVRLLYVENSVAKYKDKGWVITSGIDILNPYVDFKLNGDNFPIELREIILGPNCPDKRLNKVQIEEMVRQKKREKETDDKGKPTSISKYSLKYLKVKLSKIESYRIP
ncbi:MAG: hypothetical protein IH948_09155, partial [Bacteroidetes bacterium]|nr:hypothetical protein [Bacteroidota bacterium]